MKDFPCYGDSRWIPFVGRITNYTARCVLTVPQMQIMQADLPHTLYKRDKNGKKRSVTAEEYKYNPKDPAIEKTMESLRRRERMAKGEDGLSTDELFNKQ